MTREKSQTLEGHKKKKMLSALNWEPEAPSFCLDFIAWENHLFGLRNMLTKLNDCQFHSDQILRNKKQLKGKHSKDNLLRELCKIDTYIIFTTATELFVQQKMIFFSEPK